MTRHTPSRRAGNRPTLLFLSLGLALVFLSTNARAQQELSFDLPVAPLGQSLNAVAREGGLTLSVNPGLIKGKTAPALRGEYTVREALIRLLAGTDIIASFDDNNTVTLARAGDFSDAVALDPVRVEGAGETAWGPISGYAAGRSATATRTDTSIIDTPQAIQVLSREVIEDQQANSLAEVVKNISNVEAGGTSGNRRETLRIRGFNTSLVTTDGMTGNPQFGDRVFPDLANIERVEILKGPGSVLYGLGDPGGVVNIVTKKPLEEPYYAADITVGSHEFIRPAIDASTPLNNTGSLKFRFNGAWQRSDSFRDFFTDAERIFLAPVGTWDVTPETRLTLSAQYTDQENQFDRGLVAVGNEVADIPIDRFLGEAFSIYDADQTEVRYLLEHEFNDTWKVRNSARFINGNALRFSADPLGIQADNRTLNRRARRQQDDAQEWRLQNDIIGRFMTDAFEHKLLIGLELARTDYRISTVRGPLDPIDIFNPVYGARPDPFNTSFTIDNRFDIAGLYMQDQISIGERWHILVGGRYDYVDIHQDFSGDVIKLSPDEFSPRFGLVYKPADHVSLYANYGQSFQQPELGASADGTPFQPETGGQYEAGIKTEFFNRRLAATLAVFHLTRENVVTSDPDNPSFAIQTGEQRSRGIEIDVIGEVMPGWNVIASGSYIDAEIIEDNTFDAGNKLNNVPRISGSFWSTYEFQQGVLQGFGFGGGLFAASQREGDLANSFEVDSDIRADAAAYYRYSEHIEASLNIKNIFEAEYIESTSSRTEIYPGAPLTVLGTLSIRF